MCCCSQQAHFPFKSTSKMLPPPQMVPIFDFSPFRIKHVLLLLLCVLFAEKSSNEKTNYKKCQKWLSLCRQGKCFPVSQLLKNILKSKLFSSSAQSVCWCHVLFWTWKYVKNTYQLFIYARGKLTTQNFYLFCTCSHFSINTEDEFLQRWSFIWMLRYSLEKHYKNDLHLLNFFHSLFFSCDFMAKFLSQQNNCLALRMHI